jgi:isoquinoline 1-oxidoreductase alpha subunit
MNTITFSVNGRTCASDVSPERSLWHVLQNDSSLTATCGACENGRCMACTVHVDGLSKRACRLPLSELAGKHIVTIEGLAASEGLPPHHLHAVQKAWIEEGVPACACQSGLIMAAAAVLMQNAAPSSTDIEQAIYLDCGCGIRPHIHRVIRSMAERLEAW